MKILAFETATEACSVALWIDGEVRERFEIAPRRHAELALPWADALLAEAGIAKSQIDAVACGRGPGAFTGVRLAVALTQGLAFALDRPVLGISTLAALALDAAADAGDRTILAAIDARMGEIYLGAFLADALEGVRAVSPEMLVAPALVPIPAGHYACTGTGFAAERGVLAMRLGAQPVDAAALPHAAAIARLAARAYARGEAILPPDALEPAYLRNKVALTLAEQGKV